MAASHAMQRLALVGLLLLATLASATTERDVEHDLHEAERQNMLDELVDRGAEMLSRDSHDTTPSANRLDSGHEPDGDAACDKSSTQSSKGFSKSDCHGSTDCSPEATSEKISDWPTKSTTDSVLTSSPQDFPEDELFAVTPENDPETQKQPKAEPESGESAKANGQRQERDYSAQYDPMTDKNTQKFFEILVNQMPPPHKSSSRLRKVLRLRKPVLRLVLGVLLGFFAQTMGIDAESVHSTRKTVIDRFGEREGRIFDYALLFMEAAERRYHHEGEQLDELEDFEFENF